MFLQRLLAPDDEMAGFTCGVDTLDDWLARHARRSHDQGIVRVYVWVDDDAPDLVIAYSAIQPTQLAASDLNRGQARGHGSVAAYLIARLALDQRHHGTGLGAQLLIGTLEVCVDAAHVGGGRVIVVDPIGATAASFYENFGFTSTKGPSGRLVMKVSTAAAAIGM